LVFCALVSCDDSGITFRFRWCCTLQQQLMRQGAKGINLTWLTAALHSILSVSVWKLIGEFQYEITFSFASFSFSMTVHIYWSDTVPYKENSKQTTLYCWWIVFGANDWIKDTSNTNPTQSTLSRYVLLENPVSQAIYCEQQAHAIYCEQQACQS
jgi:hypothetical protein